MYRLLFRFFVITTAILSANLLTAAVGEYLVSYRNHVRPAVFTLTGMGITVVVFYPLFTRMEVWLKAISARFMKTGKSLAGKYFGLIIAFILAFVVLFYFYVKLWYDVDLLKALFRGTIGNYI